MHAKEATKPASVSEIANSTGKLNLINFPRDVDAKLKVNEWKSLKALKYLNLLGTRALVDDKHSNGKDNRAHTCFLVVVGKIFKEAFWEYDSKQKC